MRNNRTPQLVILAGPNGAGKSTAAPALLQGSVRLDLFVNADTIARGLAAFDPQDADALAGRLMLERMHELADRRENFAVETTISGRTLAAFVDKLQAEHGYQPHLLYLWLATPEAAVARVESRVRAGGHDIPSDTVRRRYHAGVRNLVHLYSAKMTTWSVYNNCASSGPQLIARGGKMMPTEVLRSDDWQRVLELANATTTL